MIRLSGEMKNIVLALHGVGDLPRVTDIAFDDRYVFFYGFNIKNISPQPGREVIENGHLRPSFHQGNGKVAPDEPESPGNKNFFTNKSTLHQVRL